VKRSTVERRFAAVRKEMKIDPWEHGCGMLADLYEDALKAIAKGEQEGDAAAFAELVLSWHQKEERRP
jgi:hypothetical protein